MKGLRLIMPLLMLAALCACGNPADTPAVPEESAAPSALRLEGETAEEILALAELPGLKEVDGGDSRELDALMSLARLRPDCRVSWSIELGGTCYDSATTELALTDPEDVEYALKYLPELKFLDLSACDVSAGQMDAYSALRNDVEFLWNVSFGEWQVRSDITCFSTLRTGEKDCHRYTSEELYPLLRYCRSLVALDLGHNALTDISLIGEMSQMQVLILADNPGIVDASPIGRLRDLEYLELFLCTDIESFDFLYELENMVDLNLSYCENLCSVDFIDLMPNFRNGWFRSTGVTWDMVRPYERTRDNSSFLCGSPVDPSSVFAGWRSTERSSAMRNAFSNWRRVAQYRHWDDIIWL